MSLAVNHLIGFGAKRAAAGGGDATVTAGGSATSTSFSSGSTFSAVNISTASATRYVVAVFVTRGGGSGSASISSFTIGGVSATAVVNASASADDRVFMYIAAVPTGTTADVTISGSSLGSTAALMLWAVYDLNSATATQTGTSTNADPSSASLNISAGGVAIGGGYTIPVATSATWTNLTENFDATFDTNRTYSGASAAFASAQTSLSLSCDWASSAGSEAVVFAAFR
jgi:hypothetical protein